MVKIIPSRPGGCSRNNHLTVLIFLAVLGGSGGRACNWPAQCGCAERRHAGRTAQIVRRCDHRNVFLELCYVLHYPDDGRHSARARKDQHRNCASGGGSATASRGERRLSAVHAGIDWDRHSRDPSAGWLERVCSWRSAGLESVTGSETASSPEILYR